MIKETTSSDKYFGNDHCCIFYANGKQIGQFWYSDERNPRKKTLYIFNVIIEEQYRNKGFGKEMMKESVSYLKNQYPNIKKLYLNSWIENLPAIKSYLYAGYKISSFYPTRFWGKEYSYEKTHPVQMICNFNKGEII